MAAQGHRLHFFETSRGRLEYSEQGQGEPVLFFHGGQGNAQNTTFDKVFDLSNTRLVIPSRPGYGETRIDGNETAAASAQMIAELVDHLGLEPVVAIGVSLGGRPAIEFAAQFPRRTRALVLESAVTGPWLTIADKAYRRSKLFYGPRCERYVWSATRLAFRLFPGVSARSFVNNITTMIVEGVDREDAIRLREKINTMRSYSGLAADLDHEVDDAVLERIECPTFLQFSANDAMIDASHAQRAQKLIRRSTLRMYDNAFGHFMWVGPGSDAVLRDLRAFVGGLESRLEAAE